MCVGDDNDSGCKKKNIGVEAPPLTAHLRNILDRYPEGGQILKVDRNSFTICACVSVCAYLLHHLPYSKHFISTLVS